MALHSLGTAGTTSLVCLPAWAANLLDTDVGTVSNMLTDDTSFASILGFATGAGQTAIFGTGTTHTNTTLDTLVASSTAPLSQIKVGMYVLGVQIPAGTFVTAIPTGTSVTLSASATGGASGQNVAFVAPEDSLDGGSGFVSRYAFLNVPNRGRLRILPGDVIAYDPITGFPILVSGAAIAQTGSLWTFT